MPDPRFRLRRSVSFDTGVVAEGVSDALRWRVSEIDALREALDEEELHLLYRRLAYETRHALRVGVPVSLSHTVFVGRTPKMCQIHLTPDEVEGQVYAVIKPLEAFCAATAFGDVGNAFLDNTNDVVLLSRADPSLAPGPTVVYVNESFSRVTGYGPGDIVGLTPRILQGHGTSREARARIRERLQRWEQCREQMINYRRDGTEFLTELNICPIRSASGWYTYWLSVQREVTAEVEARRRREERGKLEAIGALASGIAHEINTPAQYVQENLRFIAEGTDQLARCALAAADPRSAAASGAAVGAGSAVDGRPAADEKPVPGPALPGMAPCAPRGRSAAPAQAPPVAREDLEYLAAELPAACAEALDGLQRITKTIAAMSHLTHPRQAEKTRADVARLVDDAVTLTRGIWRPVAEVEVRVDADVGALWCDGHGITQCLVNLIVNAAHALRDAPPAPSGDAAAPPGRILVRAGRDGGDEVVITVHDNGPGVPEHLRSRIFNLFFTTKGMGEGTGQGLALAREIVEQRHHGRLRLLGPQATPGACFEMRLPDRPDDAVDAPVTS